MENTKSNSSPEFYTNESPVEKTPAQGGKLIIESTPATYLGGSAKSTTHDPVTASNVEKAPVQGRKLIIESTPATYLGGAESAQPEKSHIANAKNFPNPSFIVGAAPSAALGVIKAGLTPLAPLPVTAAKLGERLGNNPQVQEMMENGKEVLVAGMQKTREMIDTVRGAIPESVKQASMQAVERTAPLIGVLRRGASLVGKEQDQSRKQEESISR